MHQFLLPLQLIHQYDIISYKLEAKGIYMRKLLMLFLCCLCFGLYARDPSWLNSLYKDYPKEEYVAAVGEGSSRNEAEINAISNLSRIFGITINSDDQAQIRRENNNVNRSATQDINISSSHNLINVSIDEVWEDTKKEKFYAVAIIPSEETSKILEDLFEENIGLIDTYLDIADFEEDLLYKFSFLNIAAILAEENEALLNQYNILNQSTSRSNALKTNHNATSIRAQSKSVARKITFGVTTESEGTAKAVIEESIASFGMRINNTDPMYTFTETINYSGNQTPYGVYLLEYISNIEFMDANNSVLAVFSYQGKEGGKDYDAALQTFQRNFTRDLSSGNNEKEILSLKESFADFLNTLVQ